MKGKVKCTCGWSWNKSDSSKKDMYICHECGRDNSNNMKNGGWLDSYADGGTMQEHQENYNDYKVSAPEGFKGTGYSNVGRNYSPAWGGQFQMGGNVYPVNYVPQAQEGIKTYSYPLRDKLYPGEDEYFKANPHVGGMAAEDNQVILNPYSPLSDEEKNAIRTNETARLAMRNGYARPTFDLTPEQQEAFKNYSTDEQDQRETIIGRILSGDPSAKNVTPEQKKYAEELQKVLKFQGGGSIPGAVGFTYARTKGIPSNGPYAKKTMASAQNGVDMYDNPLIARMVNNANIDRSYYDPRLNTMNMGSDYNMWRDEETGEPLTGDDLKYQQDKMLAHENYHAMQHKEGRDNYDIAHSTDNEQWARMQKRPEVMSTDAVWNNFYNRSAIENIQDYANKINEVPEARLINQQLLFDKVLDRERYDNPSNLEGEAKFYEDTGVKFQNGGEMRYYQEGLDWKPKTISKNGGWLDGYEKAQDGDLLDKWRADHPTVRSFINDAQNRKIQAYKSKGKETNIIQKDNVKTATPKIGKIATAKGKEQRAIEQNKLAQQQSEQQAAKDWVQGSMEEAYKSPLMSPGYFTPEGVAIGALQGATKMGPDLYEGNYKGAAIDALMALPIGIPAAKKLLPRFTPKQNYNLPEYMSLEAPKGNMYGENQVLIQQQRLLHPDIKAKFFKHQAPEFVPSQTKNSLLNFEKTPKDFGNRITPKNYEDFVNRVHGSTDYDFAASASKKPENLGIGNYNMPGKVFKDAPLNELGKDIINAHEKNHGIFAGTLSKEMQESLLKPFGTKQAVPHYAGKHQADEVLARMGQFKNAVGIGDNQTFTLGHLNLIRKNYANSFLDNSITEMLAKIKPGSAGEKEFLKNMNKYAFGLTPAAVIGAGTLEKQRDGGIIKDDRGQWDHPGEITEIGSNQITMEGVPYDVLGISDTGDTKLMKPGKNYKFKGKKVTEFPMAKNGLRQEQKGLVNLDNLLNFTNYNKPQPGGWLDSYK